MVMDDETWGWLPNLVAVAWSKPEQEHVDCISYVPNKMASRSSAVKDDGQAVLGMSPEFVYQVS